MGWGGEKFGVGLKSGILTLPCRVALSVAVIGEGKSPADAVLLNSEGDGVQRHNPLFWYPTIWVVQLGVWYPPASPPPASKLKDLVHWEKLGSSRKALLSKAGWGKRAAFHPSCITGTEMPENSLFIVEV